MNIVAIPEDIGPKEENKAEQAKADESKNSFARIQAFFGIIAITVGNVAAIITHVEEIRKFGSQLLGTEFVYRFHEYLLLGASALLLFGYGSITYWLYRSFVVHKGKLLQVGFFLAAVVAVGSTVVGTYWFLFKPIDPVPLVNQQLGRYVQTVLSQQVSSGEDAGGFRFSQTGTSTDAQVWTTAQCLTALLVQDVSLIKDAGSALRRAFDYIERSQLKSSGSGWRRCLSILHRINSVSVAPNEFPLTRANSPSSVHVVPPVSTTGSTPERSSQCGASDPFNPHRRIRHHPPTNSDSCSTS